MMNLVSSVTSADFTFGALFKAVAAFKRLMFLGSACTQLCVWGYGIWGEAGGNNSRVWGEGSA